MNKIDPVNQINFYSFLTSMEKPGSPIHPTLPLMMSMFLQWKLTVVCVGVSRGYTDHHQGRAIHMADSRIH